MYIICHKCYFIREGQTNNSGGITLLIERRTQQRGEDDKPCSCQGEGEGAAWVGQSRTPAITSSGQATRGSQGPSVSKRIKEPVTKRLTKQLLRNYNRKGL